MSITAAIAYTIWGAIWWRVRGGAWETTLRLPRGTTLARCATAAAFALPLGITGAMVSAAGAAALLLGMIAAGWGDAMDMGRVAGRRWLDGIAMSGWGIVAAAPSAAVVTLLAAGPDWAALLSITTWPDLVAELRGIASAALATGAWWPLLIAGAAFGPIYAAAWWLGDVTSLPRLRRFASGPTEWAECAAGAGLAVAVYVS